MEKVDLKKILPGYTAPQGGFQQVMLDPRNYLMIDGQGDPNTAEEYAVAVTALYSLAYKLKFFSKNELGRDYVVMPLEGLWWAEDMAAFTSARDKSAWNWKMMILVPQWLDEAQVESVHAKVPSAQSVRFDTLDEGLSVQTLHLGGYDAEGPVLAGMHQEYIPAHGLSLTGHHHEIYLSDPRRTAAQKLRTILRQPVISQAA